MKNVELVNTVHLKLLGKSLIREYAIQELLNQHNSFYLSAGSLINHVPMLAVLPNDLNLFRLFKYGDVSDFQTITVLKNGNKISCYTPDLICLDDSVYIMHYDLFYGQHSIISVKQHKLKLVGNVGIEYDIDCGELIDINAIGYKDDCLQISDISKDDLNLIGLTKGFLSNRC
jgi:hypothetical protein